VISAVHAAGNHKFIVFLVFPRRTRGLCPKRGVCQQAVFIFVQNEILNFQNFFFTTHKSINNISIFGCLILDIPPGTLDNKRNYNIFKQEESEVVEWQILI